MEIELLDPVDRIPGLWLPTLQSLIEPLKIPNLYRAAKQIGEVYEYVQALIN